MLRDASSPSVKEWKLSLNVEHLPDRSMTTDDPPQPDTARGSDDVPRVWLLTDDRPGHRTQVIGLARGLGWPWDEKRLAFNRLNRLPNQILGASLISLDRSSASFAQPWPDLVIGMGRRIVPVARWIKRQSGGRTRIVLLGRKAANDPRGIDLTVACAHFQLLPHRNLVELVVPPTQVDEAALAAARATHPGLLDALRQPRVLLLVGGPTVQHQLDADFALRMAGSVAAAARALGGGLAIVTSRRTPDAAIAAMRVAAPDAHFHVWAPDRHENPYLAYLASADLIVVTGESESMLAEAAATRRPMTIYPLEPKAPGLKQRVATALRRGADESGLWGSISRRILSRGWVTAPRDLALMHQRMVADGRAALFSSGMNTMPPAPTDDGSHIAHRIAALLVRTPAADE